MADDFGGTGVLDALTEVGLATADDDLLPPGVLEPPRARILAAACSAKVTIYEVGLVVMWLHHVS